jgi:hypothetical protein
VERGAIAADVEAIAVAETPQTQLQGVPGLLDRIAAHRTGAIEHEEHFAGLSLIQVGFVEMRLQRNCDEGVAAGPTAHPGSASSFLLQRDRQHDVPVQLSDFADQRDPGVAVRFEVCADRVAG